ncbi:MAG: hypothetical protein GFH27_549283n164 [Chloroflexi bacterium AL-W]|nr:hypothetical protein [Chloroflexi bacterium AL-N1]NOK64715.1 hypothetical protein [Chloroflexi bacterium AL-N10]NOK75956.1 hypothetical protein [Chloroflexi bacterium AL-N5]NOK80285.1 hypothetical protein [Chloroflexi bacterium AL-W]NOK86798.1 hypothetical protein [Chloroflexi bacterium AL-N15]
MRNRRYHLYMCIMLVVCFLIIFVLVGFQAQAAPSSFVESTLIQARTADRFINTIGVNIHLHYSDTVYSQSFDEIIKPKLLASGIRHVRDGTYTSDGHHRDHFYYRRMFFEHFNRDIPRIYIYEFINTFSDSTTNHEASFGLLRHDESEKPAYKAIKNMITILDDTDNAFAPGKFDVTITGGDDSIHRSLLQKSNGTFYLVLWQEKPSWDRHEHKEITVPPQEFTLTLGAPIATAQLYTPLTSAESIKQYTEPDELTLSVPDHPIIIALKPTQPQQGSVYTLTLPLIISAR